MDRHVNVVALCGSLREDSTTRIALDRALDAAAAAGASVELLDLGHLALPPFDPDAEDPGGAVRLRRTLRDADAVVLGTPTYHGSYASPLKTALDYCGFDEFEDRTVGLLAVSGGSFPTPALSHLRAVCRALGAWTVPHEVGIPNSHDRFEDGRLVDEDLAARVETLGERVVAYAGVGRYPETRPASELTACD